MSRYKIEVVEITNEKKIRGKEWAIGVDGDNEKYGYTPEIEKTVEVTRILYTQNTDELDLKKVIEAVND